MTAMECVDVYASYGPYRALNGLSLSVGEGETVAVLGRNGAGKSTLARVASALVPVQSGRCTVLGHDVARASAHELARDGVVHLPEGTGLFTGLSVEENLALRVGGSGRQRRQRLAKALALLPPALRERRRTRASALSGGQQRLVAMSAAIAAEPRLLLADEPALGLAPAAADDVYAALRAALGGATTLVVIETRLDRVRSLCRRAIVLHKGAVVADTTTEDEAGLRAALLGEGASVSDPARTQP